MDKTIKATLPSGSYLMIEVEIGGSSFTFYGAKKIESIKYNTMPSPGKFKGHEIDLPPGQYELVGKGNEISEEVWNGMVEIISPETKTTKCVFRNYCANKYNIIEQFFTGKESGHSWIKSKGMHPERTLILKIK